jgi:hypothetical protein
MLSTKKTACVRGVNATAKKSVVRAYRKTRGDPAPPVAQIPIAIRERFTIDQANTTATPQRVRKRRS